MINKIMGNALYGMNSAVNKVNEAAANIVNQPNIENKNNPTNETNVNNNNGVKTTQPLSSSVIENASKPSVDMASQMVNMMMAENAYKASTKLVKISDEMTKSLLDIEL